MYLAALHFNENSDRPQAVNRNGDPIYAVSYPKSRSGEGVSKEKKVQQTFGIFKIFYLIVQIIIMIVFIILLNESKQF